MTADIMKEVLALTPRNPCNNSRLSLSLGRTNRPYPLTVPQIATIDTRSITLTRLRCPKLNAIQINQGSMRYSIGSILVLTPEIPVNTTMVVSVSSNSTKLNTRVLFALNTILGFATQVIITGATTKSPNISPIHHVAQVIGYEERVMALPNKSVVVPMVALISVLPNAAKMIRPRTSFRRSNRGLNMKNFLTKKTPMIASNVFP